MVVKMRQTLVDLCTLLQEQKEILGNMLALAKEERNVIIEGKSEKLEEIIRRELSELGKLGGIEKQRLELHKVISRELCIPVDEEITVSKITENAEPDERDAIRKLQMELMPLIEEHAAVNMENRELVKSHLEYSNTMLELMIGSGESSGCTYDGEGKAAPESINAAGLYDGHV